MKKRRAIISVFLLLLLLSVLLLLSSCSKEEKTKFTAYSLDYFDTATTITGYEKNKADFDKVSGEIISLLGEYHKLFTIYHRFDGMENLCTVNELQNGEHRVVTVDKRIIDMLLYAKEMYTLTDGTLNIAMGSVLSIWHEYRENGLNDPKNASLPPIELLFKASLQTDIDNLIIDKESSTVYIKDPEMKLDVGAIAKGYAVEMVARSLEEKGISGYVINVGGNVRTVGAKPNGDKWLAGIENPDFLSDNAYVEYLKLAGEAVVTSGSYQRFYTVDGKNYHHIIDKNTLMPAESYLSVSIVCKDSGLGDALSTALFCMSVEDGLALVENLPDTEALWILPDGTKQSSSGFSRFVTVYP